jgi:hypothetical protein
MSIRGITVSCTLLAVLFLSMASTVRAEGGNSIATGPAVVYGQQEFGNTALSPHLTDPRGWDQFWNLSVTAGDKLTIDWEATPDTATRLLLYPVGTTDYTIGQQEPATHQGQNSEGKNELHYVVPATGIAPLVVNTGGRGHTGALYNFIAYVQHALAVSLPRLAKLIHHKKISVHVHTPEGGEISDESLMVTLEAKARGGSWKTLGKAPVVNSSALVRAKVPSVLWHQRVSVRATASGGAYLPTRSRIIHTNVS